MEDVILSSVSGRSDVTQIWGRGSVVGSLGRLLVWIRRRETVTQFSCEHKDAHTDKNKAHIKHLAELNNTWLLSEEWGVSSGE